MMGGIEKSSENDSTGVSEMRRPNNVTGAPSSWDTTQRQTKQMSTAVAFPSNTPWHIPLSVGRMARTILKPRLVGKSSS